MQGESIKGGAPLEPLEQTQHPPDPLGLRLPVKQRAEHPRGVALGKAVEKSTTGRGAERGENESMQKKA